VLLGDSITAHAGSEYRDVFEGCFGGLSAAPLGVYGNTVKELAFRVMVGFEGTGCRELRA